MREYKLKFYPLFLLFIISLALYEFLEVILEKYHILDSNNFSGMNLFIMVVCGFILYVLIRAIIIKMNNSKAPIRLFLLSENFGISSASNTSTSIRFARFNLILPFILLSVLPLIISLISDNITLYKFSFYMLAVSLGDLYMLYLIRKEKGDNIVIDKNDAKGFIVYNKE